MKEQIWLAVDGHGREYAFSEKPWRDFPNLDLRVKWGQRWITDSVLTKQGKGVMLPKGTIESMSGRVLTYADEPLLIEFDDYGNYEETRPEVLNKTDDGWPEF